jgi:hypothetical protein
MRPDGGKTRPATAKGEFKIQDSRFKIQEIPDLNGASSILNLES